MIHRIEIENFFSFRDRQILDLRAAGNAPDNISSLRPLWPGASERAPQIVALFGPNGSGKSTVLKALSFIRWFIVRSFSRPANETLPFWKFHTADGISRPTSLSILLSGPEDVSDPAVIGGKKCQYAYELVLGSDSDGGHIVIKEALYYWPEKQGRRTRIRLFERDQFGQVTSLPAFGLSGYRRVLEKILRKDVSVISTLAQMEHPFSKMVLASAANIQSNILLERDEFSEERVVQYLANAPDIVGSFNADIAKIDLGVETLSIERTERGIAAQLQHQGLSAPLPLIHESRGTRMLLRLYPLITIALQQGSVAILDELDAAIHPLLLPEILRWFRDPSRNPHGAQLWMTCHNASLLEDLEKEEIFFCEKDHDGSTTVYGLKDVQNVRRQDNFYQKYLGGVYGAVPRIG